MAAQRPVAVARDGQALRDHRLERLGQLRGRDRPLLGRHHRQDALDRLGRVGAVHRRQNLMAGIGGTQGHPHRLAVAQLADQDHVGILPQGLPQPMLERRRILAQLELRDHGLLIGVHVFDGSSIVMILQRKELLIRSTIAASVVLLPLPVVPVKQRHSASDSVISRSTGGSWSSSSVRILSWMVRSTIAGVPMWL